jgi:uncharacterized membrane protein
MTREAFLARLREGLSGMSPQAKADILADYEQHFIDAQADGRSEDEVAEALGNPGRLARELRMEAGMKRWEEVKTPSAAAGAIIAVLGLGAIDILILLPILFPLFIVLLALFIVVIVLFFVGGMVFGAGPFADFPGGPATAILAGLGLMAGSASGGAVLTLITVGLVNALVWYARLHYRLLKPAIEPEA